MRQGADVLMMVVAFSALAWTARGDDEGAAASEPILVATVDGTPILSTQVEKRMRTVIDDSELTDAARTRWQAETLRQLVDQELAAAYLFQRRLAASEQDIDLEIARLQRHLDQQDQTLEAFLRQGGISEDELRREISWRLSWRRYLDRARTDETLSTFFEQHRRDFDGTELRVSHLLLLVDEEKGESALDAALARAKEIGQGIASGDMTFDEATGQFSEAPTAAEGGELGWIRRHEPMSEAFSQAAFDLEIGQISEPIVTSFGVHLIRCNEERPGEKSWEEVRDELASAVARSLFRQIVDHRRPLATIEFSGAMPYFDLETGNLVEP